VSPRRRPGIYGAGDILDASAVLAYVYREPGHEHVRAAIAEGATIGAVNLAEVHSTLEDDGVPSSEVVERLRVSGLDVEPFGPDDAATAGRLRRPTRALGLSLADRACLALALRLGRPVLTTDGDLARADVGVDVQVIR
jgi:PIN domain nuclease of toxin-antitoxin system